MNADFKNIWPKTSLSTNHRIGHCKAVLWLVRYGSGLNFFRDSSRISIGLWLLIRNNWSSLFTKNNSNWYLFSWKLNALKCNSDHKIKSIFVFIIKTKDFEVVFNFCAIFYTLFSIKIFFLYISLSKVATRCLEKNLVKTPLIS